MVGAAASWGSVGEEQFVQEERVSWPGCGRVQQGDTDSEWRRGARRWGVEVYKVHGGVEQGRGVALMYREVRWRGVAE